MSRSYGPEIKFKCLFECERGGCPGHKVHEIHCRSTNTYTFEIDGREAYVFDENKFHALIEAHAARLAADKRPEVIEAPIARYEPDSTEPHDYRESGGGLCAVCAHGITHESHAKQHRMVEPPERTQPAVSVAQTSPTAVVTLAAIEAREAEHKLELALGRLDDLIRGGRWHDGDLADHEVVEHACDEIERLYRELPEPEDQTSPTVVETLARLPEIKARAEKATPGPWCWYFSGTGEGGYEHPCGTFVDTDERVLCQQSDRWERCNVYCSGWPANDELIRGTRATTEHEHRLATTILSEDFPIIEPSDADFIAHARTDIPALVATVEALQRQAGYKMNREVVQGLLIAASGTTLRSSDCATSVAPAEEPGVCDCNSSSTYKATVEAQAAELRVVSSTFGDLVKVAPNLATKIEPHQWDNKTPSEQRDWVVEQSEAQAAELDTLTTQIAGDGEPDAMAAMWMADRAGLPRGEVRDRFIAEAIRLFRLNRNAATRAETAERPLAELRDALCRLRGYLFAHGMWTTKLEALVTPPSTESRG